MTDTITLEHLFTAVNEASPHPAMPFGVAPFCTAFCWPVLAMHVRHALSRSNA